MNAKLVIVVIGLVLVAGFVAGFAYASSLTPAPVPAKTMVVEVVGYSSDPAGEMTVVSDDNYTLSVGTAGLQLGTNTTFVRDNKIESWGITLHNS